VHSFSTLLRVIWRSSKRAAVFVVGVALVGVGLVMFVTPGPGIVLVVAGLAVLATEFAWAEHLLDKAKTSAAKAGQSAQKLPGVSRAATAAGRLVPARWRKHRGGTDGSAEDDPAAAVEAADNADEGAATRGAAPGFDGYGGAEGTAASADAVADARPAVDAATDDRTGADAATDDRTAADVVADGETTRR
jgi:uncharacterized protein (TIGR02611 family)